MEKDERDWEQHYLDSHTPWDKGAPAPALQEVIAAGEITSGAEVLVPGCGYGHDVLELAQTGCIATGLDISPSAIAAAKQAGGADRCHYAMGDFFDPALAKEQQYDAIWEHTCFCAILPSQRDNYVESAYRLLKPGGILIGVFFAFADEPDVDGPPFKSSVDIIHHHFKPRFTLEWERHPARSFPSREGQEWLMCWRRPVSQPNTE
ncbi:MAG: methyltransferase domain-containing protein [Verrucomicrobiae bacterium]|nr:methyltransferase domain-containing protein [Verrucomicrobiae bacterium]NNJ86236.1 methyltransferase domain-containing protein [Akkermansiaceae bacterium]